MVGIVLVSHSHLLAQGLRELAMEMSRGVIHVAAAGGLDEDTIGLDAKRIEAAIRAVYSAEGVLILFDLGSALLSTQLAIESFTPEQQRNIHLSDAPIVEGAIAAVVEASLGHGLEQIKLAAEATVETKRNIVRTHTET